MNGVYLRRDHINLTSANIDLAVDAGLDDETPDDPTDDRYGTNKVLLWLQHDYNIGDESYGFVDTDDGTPCAVTGWEQDSATVPEGELPPLPVGIAATNYLDPMGTSPDGLPAQHIAAGAFEPARNISEIKNNKVSSGDPRLGTTPPTYPLVGRVATLPNMCPQGNCVFVEDTYVNNMFFVALGTVNNLKSTGSTGVKAEASSLDIFYTRTEDYGDNYLKVPWVIGGQNSNQGYGETVWRYDFLVKGEPEEQGECQLRATSDGSKAYAIYHSMISAEEDPEEEYTRWYPWKPSESTENDIWFRRLIFWPDAVTPLP